MRTFKETIGQDSNTAIAVEYGSSVPESFSEIFSNQLPTLKLAEQTLIELAMEQADGNQGIAAGLLGISRQALNKRLLRDKDQNTETN